ncbi:ThuA domain-containing protein [Zavarzinella formosa]|uniref:ThuA domain-containing protein n=1 Tax=Zavarzinella formosa TaxID=360055 RepID=UPI00030765A8|nr:ThuA domain-containing protein [Zavarzinella formosa]
MKNLLSALIVGLVSVVAGAAEPIKVLIVDGQNNHNWKVTTPILKKILEETKLFTVDVATSPQGKSEKPVVFRPKFSDYQVVVSNYNGQAWPKETQADFVKFVTDGGGFVAVHAADNSFPEWPEYNVMIGVGGWGGRNEKSGPYIRFREGKFVLDTTKGNGGSHGAFAPFVVETRDAEHPITKGLPEKWMHAGDELYDRLRGPAKNVTVLATAFADPKKGGSGENEPMLMVIPYEKGRVFHTTLGHSDVSMKCAGFQVTFARGVEWAATGKVTQAVPADFPTAEKVSARP